MADGLRRKRGKFDTFRHVEEFERDTDETLRGSSKRIEDLEALVAALEERVFALENP